MRSLSELLSDDPAWPLVQKWVATATNPVEVLPGEQTAREKALVQTQVTTRSPMGAVAYHTGGLLFDHGWLRFLGGGCQGRLERTLPGWNCRDHGNQRLPGAFLVADDAVGGFFALNGGTVFPGKQGDVFYLAPDTLAWQALGGGYTELLRWACSGDLATFYRGLRWRDWQGEVSALSGDRIVTFYPFLFTQGGALEERLRGTIPVTEAWGVRQEFRRSLEGAR